MDETQDDSDEERKKRGGKSSGGGGGVRLPPNKLKEVMEAWQDLDAIKVVERLAEFAGEGPLRASANAEVSWQTANLQEKGFAIVHHVVEVMRDLRDYMRDPARKAGADRLRKKLGFVPTSIMPAG